MPSTASEMEVLRILQMGRGKGNGARVRRIVEGPAGDEDCLAYPLVRDVVKGAPAGLDWGRVDVLDYVGHGKYLDAESFGVLSVKGCDFCIKSDGLIRLTAHSAFNKRERRMEPLSKLELKTAMDVPFARDTGKLEYAQRLEKLYEEVLFEHSPVIRLAQCCRILRHGLILFLSYLELGRSISMFEDKIRKMGEDCCSPVDINGSSKLFP